MLKLDQANLSSSDISKIRYTIKSAIKDILKSLATATLRFILPNFWRRWEQQKYRLNDWAQLEVYSQSNINLSIRKIAGQRVVFFGDSITEFWNLEYSFPSKNYINRGISGQTTPQMLVRFRPDVISLDPQVVIFLAGINDITGNTGFMTLDMTKNNYLSICELAQINNIRVIFASVLPIAENSTIKQLDPKAPDKIRQLNQWIQAYCNENHHTYLDYYSAMINDLGMLRNELSDDGVHPNNEGYQVMTSLVEIAIQQAIANK